MNNSKYRYNKIEFSQIEIKDIVDSYLRGESSPKIGKRYGVGHKVILRVLHELNIPVDQKRLVRKYSLDEHYFDDIDNQNKAYILGLLYSDGSNNPNKSTVSLALQEEDGYILEVIRRELKSGRPLEYLDYSSKHDFGYNYKNQYRLVFYSSYICCQLSNLGVVRNKSLKITFPKFLRKDLLPHFIRGVYDGDGSIYRSYRNDNNLPITVTITATNSFCKSLQELCQEELGITAGIYDASCHNGITKVFTLSGRNIAKKFLDWIYLDANIYLQRKYDRYIDYYNINNSLAV